MKKITFILVLLIFSTTIFSQNFTPIGGEYLPIKEKTECLTETQRNVIITMLQENQLKLTNENKRLYNPNNRGGNVLFDWPVTKSTALNYNSIWGISNYVDHNAAYPNQLSDYNCEERTYDTSGGYNHRGIDIYTWPFSWKLMDNDEAVVIAGASGQIIAKTDGNFDRNCDFTGDGNWNAIYVEHPDGTVAWYGHMKSGSLTPKGIGDSVSQGEFLGVIGSSGFSTGPHLHFEVWQDDSYTNLLDPYAGACNTLNANSMWQSQKPHENPNVNAVLTHSSPPVFNTCPTTEITNESDQFDPADQIYFDIYMRDQMNSTSVNLKIIRPNDTVLYDWNFNFTADYYSSYWYWSYSGVYDVEGEWKWQATYEGQTVTHTFNVGDPLSIVENDFNLTHVYPNPFNDTIIIDSNSNIVSARLVDVSGKVIFNITNASESIKTIDTRHLSQGLYFLQLQDESNQEKTVKLIKE
jgi:murein DD-endopeptidase MepM/ murein hydrolase activator NlpD